MDESQTGTEGQAPEAPQAQAATDEGQAPASGDGKQVVDLRREAAKYRKSLRDAEASLAKYQQAEQERQEQESLAKGEHEKLIASLKEQNATLAETLRKDRLKWAIQAELSTHRPRPEEVPDIIAALSGNGLEVGEDGKVDGLADKIGELKASKPWRFLDDSPARGLPGHSPANQMGSKMPITEAIKAEAARRGMKPEDWRDIQETLAQRRTARAGT